LVLAFGCSAHAEERGAFSEQAAEAASARPPPRFGWPIPERYSPERDDVIDEDGHPVDLRPLTSSERRKVVDAAYPLDDEKKRAESRRRYVEHLYKSGRIDRQIWERLTAKHCRFGPAIAPAGMTDERFRQIVREGSGRPKAETWERIMSEPPVAGFDAEPPLIVALASPDGPNCSTAIDTMQEPGSGPPQFYLDIGKTPRPWPGAERKCWYGPAVAPEGMTEERLNQIMRENDGRPRGEVWQLIMGEPPRAASPEPKPIVIQLTAPDGPNCVVGSP
jgi:hypothetical protein